MKITWEANLLFDYLTVFSFLCIQKVRCGHISGRFSYPGIMEAGKIATSF